MTGEQRARNTYTHTYTHLSNQTWSTFKSCNFDVTLALLDEEPF